MAVDPTSSRGSAGEDGKGHGDRRFGPMVALTVAAVGLCAISMVQDVPNRHSIEDNLTIRSQQALRSAGLSDVEVSFLGRDGSLRAGSATDADRAEAIVRGLAGVRVADATTTAPAAAPAPTAASPRVSLAVDGGLVTLTGNVPAEAARAALVDAAAAAYGVAAVDDQLVADATVSDAGLSGLSGVLSALGRDAKGVMVQLHDGTITLSGTVSSIATKDAVVAAAQATVGQASAVTNQLQVAEVQVQLINLPPITFVDNSATLTAAGQAALVRAAAILKENPTTRVSIEGHTDTKGSAASNLALSRARALTVLNVLNSLGVAKTRMTSQGFGESRLRVPDTTAGNKAINRRVEFIVQR